MHGTNKRHNHTFVSAPRVNYVKYSERGRKLMDSLGLFTMRWLWITYSIFHDDMTTPRVEVSTDLLFPITISPLIILPHLSMSSPSFDHCSFDGSRFITHDEKSVFSEIHTVTMIHFSWLYRSHNHEDELISLENVHIDSHEWMQILWITCVIVFIRSMSNSLNWHPLRISSSDTWIS